MEIEKPIKKQKKLRRHRTQCMKVGEIKCLFLSCWYEGRSPLLTLGPSWPFTCFIVFFAGMIFAYFMLMLSMCGPGAGSKVYFSYGGLIANIMVLFAGILKNPGIPQPVIDRVLKER
jgi:hypothetical protein